MIQLEVYGKPEPWSAPRLGRTHAYDPKAKEKESVRWQIRSQYREELITGRVQIDMTFFFPIPKNTSCIKRKQMLAHIITPVIRPDTTNLYKFYEDCLKGIVITDDNSNTDISARKRYSNHPRVLIRVIPMIQNKVSTEEKVPGIDNNPDLIETVEPRQKKCASSKKKLIPITSSI